MGPLASLGEPEEVWRRLLDPGVALLGERRLVRPHGLTGMAWNPADDLCTSFRVRRIPSDQSALSAEVLVA